MSEKRKNMFVNELFAKQQSFQSDYEKKMLQEVYERLNKRVIELEKILDSREGNPSKLRKSGSVRLIQQRNKTQSQKESEKDFTRIDNNQQNKNKKGFIGDKRTT